jgi:Ricin-type beta-trefoil lectin domain/IPT/TIG domain
MRTKIWLLSATAVVTVFASPAAMASASTTAAARTGHAAARTAAASGPDYKAACTTHPARGYAACLALFRTNVPAHKGANPFVTPSGYGPAQLQSAYSLPSSTAGSGATVALVDAYDDPNAESDLAVYRSQYGLPACTTANGCFKKVNENGEASPLPPTEPPGDDWATEESLDIDMVSAACPLCHIDLVEGNTNSFDDLGTAVNAAVALGAQYVSNSYGGGDFSGESSLDIYYNHPGVAITASAGDDGYGVSYPAASPDVVAVGGTSLNSTGSGYTETVWGSSSGGEGTGSGCSGYESKPSWQTDSGCTDRTDNDVAAVADPNTGVAVYDTYDQGGWLVVGGTSASSPIIASVYALAGVPSSGSYPAEYVYEQHTSSNINDVTSGADGTCTPAYLCTGEVGYDGPTGWGTPNGVSAFKAPSSTSAPVVTGVSPTSGPPAGGTPVTITGTNLTGGTVAFGPNAATGVTCGATSCTATSPAGTGTVDVEVTTTGGTSAPTSADHFTYTSAPVVTGVSPTSGPPAGGTPVTITGTNLTGGTVAFGPNPATGVTCGATSCTATSPAGTGTVDVEVTTTGGTSAPTSADHFTYTTSVPTGQIKSALSGKCVDDLLSGSTNGNPIVLYSCGSSGAEKWVVGTGVVGTGGTLTNAVNGKCITAENGNRANGTPLVLYACNGSGGQVWKAVGMHLVNPASHRCMTASASSNKAPLVIETCGKGVNQVWTLP